MKRRGQITTKLCGLMETTHSCYLTVSVGWESRHSLAGPSGSRSLTRLHSRSWPGLWSPLKTHSCGLGQDSVPREQSDGGPHSVPCWLVAGGCPQFLSDEGLSSFLHERKHPGRARESASKAKVTVSCHRITEVTSHHYSSEASH